jgi:KaiC/GvpD/RAD55 family RecA-like ATPase
MKDDQLVARLALLKAATSLSMAVDACVEVARSIWHFCIVQRNGKATGKGIRLTAAEIAEWLNHLTRSTDPHLSPSLLQELVTLVLSGPSTRPAENDAYVFTVDVFKPNKLISNLVFGVEYVRKSDWEYFMWRNVRRKYDYVNSGEVAHIMYLLCSVINSHWERRIESGRGIRRFLSYDHDLNGPLTEALKNDSVGCHNVAQHRCVFLECCRLVGYISAHYSGNGVWVQAERLDAEFILSKLFGLPTEMPGLDHLFGGGGISMSEHVASRGKLSVGRVILIRGRFGTGKTSLAISLAAEVARKEGLAWIMPIDQTIRECKHYLESMNSLTAIDRVNLIDGVGQLSALLSGIAEDGVGPSKAGTLIMLESAPDEIGEVLDRLVDKAEATRGFALQLLVLDSANSLLGFSRADAAAIRAKLMTRIKRLKALGTNLLLVAEDDQVVDNPVHQLENIADVVIDLSVDGTKHGYTQRYIEILKSRLQRDQRGKHPFSIKSGQGITVFPSSAAVLARIRNRRFKWIQTPSEFGWKSLDDVLGADALYPGDVVVLRGEEGTFKTHIGLLFALGLDPREQSGDPALRRSLILPIRDNRSTIEALLNSPFVRSHCAGNSSVKSLNNIKVVEVPVGFVQPGRIFQILEEEFERAQVAGQVIDRVMIDNVSHWEVSCPFMRDDETFGDTLAEFLRRQQVTTLLVCGAHPAYAGSVLQSSLIDDANLLIDFSRIEFRAAQRVILRIVKSRGMQHKRDAFDINLTETRLQLGSGSKLLRVGKDGEASPVVAQLYLHEESNTQHQYNRSIRDALVPVLSRNLHVNSKDRTHLVRAIQLGAYSTVDELQILQLDEFQLPALGGEDGRSILHLFPPADWDSRWKDMAPRLLSRVRSEGGSFCAVPYYDNVGLLAYRASECDARAAETWRSIAELCLSWETSSEAQRRPESVFFYFPTEIDENYNCLFFEMLLSINEPSGFLFHSGDTSYRLEEWLAHESAITACKLLRTLCRRVHVQSLRSARQISNAQNTADSLPAYALDAHVCRHWFTTLTQFLAQLPRDAKEQFTVSPLPAGAAVAGEWYLGVPAYSAAPEVALEIIRILTTREEELERLRRGVGLPTRSDYYPDEPTNTSALYIHSQGVELSSKLVSKLFNAAFRRSSLRHYARVSRLLTFQLKRVIEIEGRNDREIDALIRSHLASLRANLSFILRQEGV